MKDGKQRRSEKIGTKKEMRKKIKENEREGKEEEEEEENERLNTSLFHSCEANQRAILAIITNLKCTLQK